MANGFRRRQDQVIGPRNVGPRDVITRLQRAWGESLFYQSRLKGPSPDRIYFQPRDVRAIDKNFAKSFSTGRMSLGDQTIDCEGELATLWERAAPGSVIASFLQEFSWLRHLHAMGEAGRGPARIYMKAWLQRFEKWSPDAWEPYATAERLVNLCCFSPVILSDADALWRSRVLTSMARQTRHLARSAHNATVAYDRLMAAMGLAIAGFSLPGCEKQADRGLELVRRELRLQMLPDGGHVSRNPSRQLAIVLRLQMILGAMEARGFPPPGYLRHMAGRASAIVQFFRCSDGGMAVFNGGYEDDGAAVAAARNIGDFDAEPVGFARHTGYQRLVGARALAIVDVGAKTKSPAGAFQSAGSMHFSSGRSRIVTNCGSGAQSGAGWASAMKQCAAHSALSFDGTAGARLTHSDVSHRRAEDPRGQLVEFQSALFGDGVEVGTYLRRLFLSSGGDDLRGEEKLADADPNLIAAARWRFHLHPTVRASLARDGKSVLLALPNKEGWRFRTNCLKMSLEKSVYCGGGGAPAASEQIVLQADPEKIAQNTAVNWAFKRLSAV